MKKIAFMLSLMLCMASSLYAITPNELVGKWKSNTITTDPTPDMPMTVESTDEMKIQDNMSAEFTSSAAMYLTIDTGVYVDLYFKVKMSGSVAVDGDKFTVTPDAGTVKVEFTEDDVRVRGVEDINVADQIRSQMFKEMKPFADALTMAAAEPMVYTNCIISNKGKTLTCTDEAEQQITFKRK